MALLLIMIMALSLVACGGNNAGGNTADKGSSNSSADKGSADKGSSDKKDDGAAKRDDVNIYCEGVWTTLDPYGQGAGTYVNTYIRNQAYETLVTVADDGSVQPCLAKEWSVSDDGLTYSFVLEEGVKFHNGEELKASDVAYSYTRALDGVGVATYVSSIESVTATGDYTVEVKLKSVYAPMLANFAYIDIVNEKFATENELNVLECGTGPYVLKDIDLNLECNMEAFPDYRRGEASIKKVKFKVITEATTAAVAFESGELDFFFCYNTSAFAPLKESGKYNTALVAQQHTAVIHLNNGVEPLNNPLVRKALAHATDRETMIAIAYDGMAAPTYLMANPTSFGVAEDLFYNHYEYDLEKAKALLTEAGYPNGLDLGDMTVIGGSYHEKYAQVWQQSLAQIGVTINLVSSESAVADCTNHEYITATMGNGFSSDFGYAGVEYYSSHTSNMMDYKNDEVTAILDEALSLTDSAKREELYREAIEMIFEDCPNIPIFNKQVPWVWDKNLNAYPRGDGAHVYYVYDMSWN